MRAVVRNSCPCKLLQQCCSQLLRCFSQALRKLHQNQVADMIAAQHSSAKGAMHTQRLCNKTLSLYVHGSKRSLVCRAAVSALDRTTQPSLQLATAKLPPNTDPARFAQTMYQWASTLTQNGANLPFVSPLRADKLPNGFQISMLRRSDKTKSFGSAGDILATVEQQDGVGSVLMVRFYEGEVAQDNKADGWVPPSDPVERLEVVLAGCKDVDTIMANMPQAIRIAAKASQE